VPDYIVTTVVVHAKHVAVATVFVCGSVVIINVVLLFCFVRHFIDKQKSNENSYCEGKCPIYTFPSSPRGNIYCTHQMEVMVSGSRNLNPETLNLNKWL
jgi:hypothetical protein